MRSVARQILRCLAAVSIPAVFVLAGCESVPIQPVDDPSANRVDAQEDAQLDARASAQCMNEFYLDYAVLAADVYRTRGATAERLQLVSDSDLIRRVSNGRDITPDVVRKFYESVRDEQCKDAAAKTGTLLEPDPFDVARGMCVSSARNLEELKELFNEGDEKFSDEFPKGLDACDEDVPAVPVSELTTGKWERVRDIEKYATTRSWRVFVPDLAIEVWRRKREDQQIVERLEYAIVFRGTTGPGGWFSNMRVLTTLLPLFWDQYRQAETSARRVVEQVYLLDLLTRAMKRDAIAKGANPKEPLLWKPPLITVVGHSLGAGLAKFVYYRVKEITRVVGFNPSPIDGARTLIAVDDRPNITHARTRDPAPASCTRPDLKPEQEPSMFFLFEQGEILTSIAPCISGPVWGAEGGPIRYCHSVNFSRGNPIDQHSMNRLACKLASHSKGSVVRTLTLHGLPASESPRAAVHAGERDSAALTQ
jgi:hypothetical protein